MSPFDCIWAVKSFWIEYGHTTLFEFRFGSPSWRLVCSLVYVFRPQPKYTFRFSNDDQISCRWKNIRTYPMNMCFHVSICKYIFSSSPKLEPITAYLILSHAQNVDAIKFVPSTSNMIACYSIHIRYELPRWKKIIWWWHLNDFMFHQKEKLRVHLHIHQRRRRGNFRFNENVQWVCERKIGNESVSQCICLYTNASMSCTLSIVV